MAAYVSLRRGSLRFLAARQSEGWARQDSNLGPRDYESPALTAELQARVLGKLRRRKDFVETVPRASWTMNEQNYGRHQTIFRAREVCH